MESTCPCQSVWRSAAALHAHLVERHQADEGQAFLLAQLAALGVRVLYTVEDGDILLVELGLQLPMPT